MAKGKRCGCGQEFFSADKMCVECRIKWRAYELEARREDELALREARRGSSAPVGDLNADIPEPELEDRLAIGFAMMGMDVEYDCPDGDE